MLGAMERATRPWGRIGLVVGVAVAGADLGLYVALGLDPKFGAPWQRTFALVFFLATYGALGWVIGRLVEARARARADKALIEAAYAELEAKQRQVLHYEKLAGVGRLAAGVAHEVRNPLGVIRSSASLLYESLDAPDEVADRSHAFIQEEIDRLDAYIASLLDYSRPLEPRPADVDAVELGRRVDDLARAELAGRDVALVVDIEQTRGQVDPDLVSRVLYSLVCNAGQSDGAGRVELVGRRGPQALVFEVADDGGGVPEEVRERIFEPFFTTRAQGTGLGLAMAEKVAQAHGGCLELVDGGLGPGGRGARFRLTVPA
jgi:two-component system, NtrC family, sensor histidine kinase HydH